MPEFESNKVFMYMDEKGVKDFASQLLTEVNKRLSSRMTDIVSEDDINHAPTAAAVYKAIASKSNYAFTPYTGDITLVTNPRTDTIYLQRNTEEDTIWSMYVYDENLGWINIGNTQLDLSNYWSKSDKDINDLSNKLGMDKKINKDDVKTITKEELYKLIADIDSKISPNTKSYTLTVEYDGPNGKAFASSIIDTYPDGATYYIPSPHIHGYVPDIDIIKGVVDCDKVVTVTYSIEN